MGINAKTLSQKLEAYRLESGYSQDLMGKLTGVSQQTYYNIEKSEPKKLDPIFIEKANKLVCNNPDESQLELIRMEASKGKRKKTLPLNNCISEEKPPKTPHNITKESSKTTGENPSAEEKEDVGSSSTKNDQDMITRGLVNTQNDLAASLKEMALAMKDIAAANLIQARLLERRINDEEIIKRKAS